jgi:hypothetical protein
MPRYAKTKRNKKIVSGDNPFINSILVDIKVVPQIMIIVKAIT